MSVSTFGCPSPESFEFAKPEDWPRWRRRFERFRIASGLIKKSEEEQINSLIYFMGDKADDIFPTLKFTDSFNTVYEDVVVAFENHFICKRNVVFERSKFNNRFQQQGENVEEFITALHKLVKYCNYGALEDELIRDRIVVGILDKALSTKLQLDDSLTLETAIAKARQTEVIKQQQTELMSAAETKSYALDAVKSFEVTKTNRRFRKTPDPTSKPQHSFVKTGGKAVSCSWCGQSQRHTKDKCPAKNASCNKCKVTGHYARVCRSKSRIQEMDANEFAFLGMVTTRTPGGKRWSVPIGIRNVTLSFKVDTGADVTAMPMNVFQDYFPEIRLQDPEKVLYGPGKVRLKTVGMFWEKLQYRDQFLWSAIYVVENLEQPLLSADLSEGFGIVRRLGEISLGSPGVDIRQEFPQLLHGIGHVKDSYTIRLKENAVPVSESSARRVPLPLMQKVQAKLEEMVLLEIIEPVDEPTAWCSGIVIVPKPHGDVRICVDLTQLNKYLKREYHPMPVGEHILGQIGKASYFSKLDANSGFWQFDLEESSQIYTTFITPFGRFKFKRLPFGISTAPEFFQKKMSQLLSGLKGVIVNMDDILIFGDTQMEHDSRLRAVLQRLTLAGMTLNEEKCLFGVQRVKFLGFILDKDGIHLDSEKVKAITEMDAPRNVAELRSFLGTVNFLGRFVKRLAHEIYPLNELLRSNSVWTWGGAQQLAFVKLKEQLSSAPILAHYDPSAPTMISADASSFGLGAVLRQQNKDGIWRVVAYGSRSLNATERRYAQIEKEGLALTWACERWRDFIIGIEIRLETDHKPLVPIFTSKKLDEITPRLQRMRLRLMRYSYSIFHTPGKELVTADLLSRKPLSAEPENELQEDLAAYVQEIVSAFPATDSRIREILQAQSADETCQLLKLYAVDGWPGKKEVNPLCQQYWQFRSEISDNNGLLLKGQRIIVPPVLRNEMLRRLHQGHQGITKCRARARVSVWWPGVSLQIETMIKACVTCIQETSNRHEPLIPSEFPSRPWQKVAMDLFKLEGKWYLLVTDFYSRYPEVVLLHSLTAMTVIEHLKSIFARHGIPEEVLSDNGPQFEPVFTSVFSGFAREWGFIHTTSSPKYAQSNGFVEAAVKIVKRSLKKSGTGLKALLEYRSTPLANGLSPSELLFGRRIRTSLPMTSELLQPKLVNQKSLRSWEDGRRIKQKKLYDRAHGVRDLPKLKRGEKVWVTDQRQQAKVKETVAPRSYVVQTDAGGEIRRNRLHLVPIPEVTPKIPVEQESGEPTPASDEISASTEVSTDKSSRTKKVPRSDILEPSVTTRLRSGKIIQKRLT